jgi:hypothetical protein
LKKSHHQEIISKELEKDALRNIIQHKEKEVLEHRSLHYRTLSDLQQAEIEKKRKQDEAEYHKMKALEAENKKRLEIAIRDELHQKEKHHITRTLSSEKELLAS